MGEVPAKPKTVPAKASWNADDGEWELGAKNARGERNGAFKFWRRDGSLCNECSFKEGRPSGPFKRFHNNGELSQEGRFADGQLDGLRTWYACDEATDEEALTAGMSPKVRRSEMEYREGKVFAVRHFDAEDKRLLPTGEPCPERPAMVPDEADYQPEAGWVLAELDAQGRRNGAWKCWSDAGSLVETAEYMCNVRHGASAFFHPSGKKSEEGRYEQGAREGLWRTYDEEGQVVREVTWRSGARHGPAVDRGVGGLYADPAIAVERGAFEDDHAIGPWSLQDAKGKTVVRRDLGARIDEETLARSPALADEARDAEAWHQLAEECRAGHRAGEALLAEARAAAMAGKVEALLDSLRASALPRGSKSAAEVAREIVQDEVPLAALANALMRGAAPGPVLRAMAVSLDQQNRSRAALDLVNAAILLEPGENAYLFTRALVLLSLGLPALALEDADERAAQKPDEALFLTTYARALYPRFEFWPAKTRPATTYDGLPEAPVQPGAKVRVVVLKYLTRLSLLREAQLAWLKPGAAVDWLLPDLERLLPAGRVKLERSSFKLAAPTDGGPRSAKAAKVVKIDEQLDLAGVGLPDLLRMARADWTALTWLCWSCGLKDVGLPKNVAAPKDFAQAAGMSAQRLWRVRDRRVTGGAVARREKAPGFSWEGTEIDALPAKLASMPEGEYAEMAAMFRWLTDERSRSPWQDNLRDS